MAEKSVVSVIIRTIGREVGLKRAIHSIVGQTYQSIELIIVNDSEHILDWIQGLEHSSLKTLKLVNNVDKHGRSKAANIGLNNATGEYIMFLDDDDWVDNGHIEKLVKTLEKNSEAVLSYTGTLLIDEHHNELGRFELEVEKKQILVGNIMPIHSVLFRSHVLNKGCYFDETLDIYEDWDFWIQLSRYGEFIYTPQISAYYVLTDGENSDAHQIDKAEIGTKKILRKWQMLWNEDEIVFLKNQVIKAREFDNIKEQNERLIDDKNFLIVEKNSLITEKDSLITEKDSLIVEKEKILNSKSWKITEPLRYIAHKLKRIEGKKYRIKTTIAHYQRFFELGSKFNGNVTYKSDFESQQGNKLCFFSHFDRDNIIDDYVIYYLKELKSVDCDIVFITTSANMNPKEISKINTICSQIIVKENIGYDFGAWRTGIQECKPFLKNYNTVMLCNDSVYAPLFKLSTLFETMKAQKFDVWSITDSQEVRYHLQSYFLVFGENVLANKDFWKFWDKYLVYQNKRNIIEKYEIGLSKFLMRKGFTLGAYCEAQKLAKEKTNITHVYWEKLIVEHLCPIVKIELLKKNPLGMDIGHIKKVISEHSSYDFQLIAKHLHRMR